MLYWSLLWGYARVKESYHCSLKRFDFEGMIAPKRYCMVVTPKAPAAMSKKWKLINRAIFYSPVRTILASMAFIGVNNDLAHFKMNVVFLICTFFYLIFFNGRLRRSK